MPGDNLDKNLQLVARVQEMAKAKGCEASQLAIAWLYAQAESLGISMVPIPGTKRVQYLESNLAALNVGVTEEELKRLNDVFHNDNVAGDRYAMKALMFDKDDK
jgi:aryl-alcohol dehydrogenase-like predicted oxidoreductase